MTAELIAVTTGVAYLLIVFAAGAMLFFPLATRILQHFRAVREQQEEQGAEAPRTPRGPNSAVTSTRRSQ